MKIYDIGFDYNKDKHCDLDGWFVDSFGDHKPILRDLSDDFKDVLYSRKELNSHFNAIGKYSNLDLDPLRLYSLNDSIIENSSPQINYVLRNGEKPSLIQEKLISSLDNLISKFVLKDDITVYRGISISTENPELMKFIFLQEGEIYVDKAFLSTSYSSSISSKYGSSGELGGIYFKIKLKKGTHCIPLYKNKEEDEKEILISRNQRFVVKNKKINIINNKRYIYINLESI